MKYAVGSVVNLVTLCLGMVIGVVVAPHLEQRILANQTAQQPPQSSGPALPQELRDGQIAFFDGIRVVGVNPAISAGTAGFYQVLSHHIQTDELIANGFDLLELQQGELNLLQRVVPKADVEAMIQRSRVHELLRVATKPAVQPEVPPK